MPGRLVLIARLVIGDIRRRKLQSLLLVVMIVAATAALAIGLGLRRVNQSPFGLTDAATRGPDVSVVVGAPRRGSLSPRALDSLRHSGSVRSSAGPFPIAFARLRAPGVAVPVQVQGRDARPSRIDQPKVVEGSWVRSGGVVLERALAASLHLTLGDTVTIARRRFVVNGLAVSVAQPFYPAQVPGVVWVTEPAARKIAATAGSAGEVLDLDLTHSAATDAFLDSEVVGRFAQTLNAAHQLFEFNTRDFVRHADHKLIASNAKVMLVGGPLLALLAMAGIATLVAGRVAEQRRRLGLLKAVGAGPLFVVGTLVAETLLLAFVGAVLGLVLGQLTAPLLSPHGWGLLGNDGSTWLDLGSTGAVVAVACAVAGVATLGPAVRGARATTMTVLRPEIVIGHRRHRRFLARIRTPAPALLLATRLVGRRPRRVRFAAAGLCVAVATMVVAIIVEFDAGARTPIVANGPVTSSAATNPAHHLMLVLSATLVALAATIAAFTAWTTVLEAQRPAAVARALGATPLQVSTGLTVAQLGPTLMAACAGIPIGLLIYAAVGGHLSEARPPVALLVGVIPATLVIVAGLTHIPARVAAQRSVAEVLRPE